MKNYINKKHSTEPEQSTRGINVPSTVDEESHNTFAFQYPFKAEGCTCKGYKVQKTFTESYKQSPFAEINIYRRTQKGERKIKKKKSPKITNQQKPSQKKEKKPIMNLLLLLL